MQEGVMEGWMLEADRYYAVTLQDTEPWTTYYGVSAAPGQPPLPAQWASQPQTALAAVGSLLFDPTRAILSHDIDEAYAMPVGGTAQRRLEGSAWGLCMAAVGQPWSTMPVTNGTEAAGWRALRGVDWRDPTALASAVRGLMAPAMAHSPLAWHMGRRHAPTPSGFCTQATTHVRRTQTAVGGVHVLLTQATGETRRTTLAPAPQVRSACRIQPISFLLQHVLRNARPMLTFI
jgi:hypothetical protein